MIVYLATAVLTGNRRSSERFRVGKVGIVTLPDSNVEAVVIVRNMSAGGMLLQVPEKFHLPPTFSVLVKDEVLLYPVSLRWRDGENAGVQLAGPPRHINQR